MIFIPSNSRDTNSITVIYCAYSSPVLIVICLLFSFSSIANGNCKLFNNSLHYELINDPLHLPRHASTGTLSNLSVGRKRNSVHQVKVIDGKEEIVCRKMQGTCNLTYPASWTFQTKPDCWRSVTVLGCSLVCVSAFALSITCWNALRLTRWI